MIKLRIVNTLFAVLSLFLITSCENRVEKTVEGWWTIDTLYYRGYDVRNCMYGNSFFFEDNLQMPIAEDNCSELFTSYDDVGDWEIILGDSIPILLKIESENVVFNGSHQVTFRRDELNKLLKMEIVSDILYVVCRKGMFNYYENRSLMQYLEKASQGE